MNELEKLRKFYERVKYLTVNHNVVDDFAVVYPSDLGEALQEVDAEWFNHTTLEIKETNDGETFVQFPQELIEELGWAENTKLKWIDNEDGSFSIQEANE